MERYYVAAVTDTETSSWLGKASMLDAWNRTNQRDLRGRVIALTALVGVISLLGFFCHQFEALGLATGHTPLGHPSVEHCWTAIVSLPAVGFIPTLVGLLSFTLTLQGRFLFEPLFKPPRAFLSLRR